MNAALPSGLKSEDGYTAKTETYVSLAPEYHSERAIRVALDVLKRASAQLKVFETFLTLSHWDTISGDTCAEPVVEVSRDELMNETHCTSAVFRKSCRKKIPEHLRARDRPAEQCRRAASRADKAAQRGSADGLQQYSFQLSEKKRGAASRRNVERQDRNLYTSHPPAIERRQQVLYLLPEIALTVQIRQRLQRVFGNRLGIYHSKYSDAERVEIWKKQLSAAPYDVILGARSAVLLPFTNLGLVIIDEEHETSFKQQDPAPRYHARSVAIMLARKFGAKVLLGSATPSLESWNNAHTGKFGLVSLMQRYNDIRLPEIEVVDIKDLQRRKMMSGPFSPRLMAAVRKALDNGEQAILFQNRRGFAPMIECRECGWVPHCDKCDVSLTYHKSLGQLTCHYCGTTYTVPEVCPCCGSRNLRGRGYGTEKVEDYVMELFPDAAWHAWTSTPPARATPMRADKRLFGA